MNPIFRRMSVNAAGVAPRVPQRIVRRAPDRQLLDDRVADAAGSRRKLVAVEPAALNRREYGLFDSHDLVSRRKPLNPRWHWVLVVFRVQLVE